MGEERRRKLLWLKLVVSTLMLSMLVLVQAQVVDVKQQKLLGKKLLSLERILFLLQLKLTSEVGDHRSQRIPALQQVLNTSMKFKMENPIWMQQNMPWEPSSKL